MTLGRTIAIVLVVVHAALFVWALLGFTELLWSEVPWRRVSNPVSKR